MKLSDASRSIERKPANKPSTLVILPCSKVKIWSKNWLAGPTPAKDAYISPVFKLHRKYAESIGAEWRILSAWYGFLHPEFEIEDYDAKFRGSDLSAQNWWRLQGLFQQARTLPRCREVVLLGGRLYRQIMKHALSGVYLPKETLEPFAGLTLGRTMSALKKAISYRGRPDDGLGGDKPLETRYEDCDHILG